MKYVGFGNQLAGMESFVIEPEYGLVKDGRDYSLAVTLCSESVGFDCFIIPNKSVVFSVPTKSIDIGDSWLFSGYSFNLLGKKVVAKDTVYEIEATLAKSWKGTHFEEKMRYLYSSEEGLVSWLVLRCDKSSKCKEEVYKTWVKVSSGIGYKEWKKNIPLEMKLKRKEVIFLTSSNLTYEDLLKILTNDRASEAIK